MNIQEREIVKSLQNLERGGYLEEKHGTLYFRLADEVISNQDGTFTVIHGWQKPPKCGWSRDLYQVKKSQSQK